MKGTCAMSAMRLCAALGLGLVLIGCDLVGPTPASLTPKARPTPPPVAPVVAQPTSRKSASLRQYLNQVERAQLSQGLLRQDGGLAGREGQAVGGTPASDT